MLQTLLLLFCPTDKPEGKGNHGKPSLIVLLTSFLFTCVTSRNAVGGVSFYVCLVLTG